jgi:epoxyqueuosine reductase
MDIKDLIKKEAENIGIDIIGFTDCRPFKEAEEILKERDIKGYLSGFEEKDINKRINPDLYLKDCKTIISAGISYNNDAGEITDKDIYAHICKISRSSWGQDYHGALNEKLQILSDFIKQTFGGSTAKFVDTGPLLDREIARRSGIGFTGKNCSIINEEYGSFIFLGEIITNIFIEQDLPKEDSCLDCDLCIKACPTGALCSPYTLNARECISFITQDKNITFEKMQNIGNNIYGCDVCQSVCPKNKAVRKGLHREFIPEKWNAHPDAVDIINIDNKTYRDTFKKTSSGWRGKKVLQRNAVIALGNSKNKENAAYIKELLSDGHIGIRNAAVYALYTLLGSGSKEILREHLQNENDNDVRTLITKLLM